MVRAAGAYARAFGVKGPGGLQGTSALSQHIRYSVMMRMSRRPVRRQTSYLVSAPPCLGIR